MRNVFCIIFILLSTFFSGGYAQCKSDLISLFTSYQESLRLFDIGVDIFNMKFTQKTVFNDGDNEVIINSSVNLVSNGVVKYLETDDTKLCSDKKYQILIDDRKKSITIGVVSEVVAGFESNLSFLDSILGKNAKVVCDIKNNLDERSFWITSIHGGDNRELQRIRTVLSHDLKRMISYNVDFGDSNPIKSIKMNFQILDFNCENCWLPVSVESLVFSSSGELKKEYTDYKLEDLR